MEKDKKRIEFIDLAKGVCILLVVLYHSGIDVNCLISLRMPLYFVLSGMFFKMYGGFGDLLIRKINKLLVPFLFFYLGAYVLFYFLSLFAPSLLITQSKGIMDVFSQRELFNDPIWFLLCLFWSNILFSFACTMASKMKILLPLTIIVFSCLGWVLGESNIFVPLYLDGALTSLPFFYFGYLLKNNSSLLNTNKYERWNMVFIILLCGLTYSASFMFNPSIAFLYNAVEGGIIAYFVAFCSVLALLLLCKKIKHIPFISYLGKYSIIILCTHHLIYRPIKLIAVDYFSGYSLGFIIFGVTIAISYFLIPLCIKYIPCFVAQKDFLKIGDKRGPLSTGSSNLESACEEN